MITEEWYSALIDFIIMYIRDVSHQQEKIMNEINNDIYRLIELNK